MPASFAPLTFHEGTPSLHCPATGRMVHSAEDGTDTEAAHSPYLRFFVDWAGNAYVAKPEALAPEQAAYQREVIRVLGAGLHEYEHDEARVAACCAVMPSSALVLEMRDASEGSYDGEVAWYGFDLAPLSAEDGLTFVQLVAVPRHGEDGADDSSSSEPEPDPRMAPFGYFGTDQFGVGMFRWSTSAQAILARYVHEDLLGGLLEDDQSIAAVSARYDSWKQSGVGLSDVAAQLNELTGDESTIVWYGSFAELCTGSGEFGREVREAWRENRGGCSAPVGLGENESVDGPVADADLDEFVVFLTTYGH